jgi:hypothetical protein
VDAQVQLSNPSSANNGFCVLDFDGDQGGPGPFYPNSAEFNFELELCERHDRLFDDLFVFCWFGEIRAQRRPAWRPLRRSNSTCCSLRLSRPIANCGSVRRAFALLVLLPC